MNNFIITLSVLSSILAFQVSANDKSECQLTAERSYRAIINAQAELMRVAKKESDEIRKKSLLRKVEELKVASDFIFDNLESEACQDIR